MPKKPTRRELDAMMADLIKDNYTNAPPLPDHFAASGSHPKDPMLLAIEQNKGIAELFMTSQGDENGLDDTLGRAYALRHKADQLLEKRDFRQARIHYVEAATTLCGRIPYRAKFLCDKYLELKSTTPSVVATLCCVGAARCMYELREYEEVSGSDISTVPSLMSYFRPSNTSPKFMYSSDMRNSRLVLMLSVR